MTRLKAIGSLALLAAAGLAGCTEAASEAGATTETTTALLAQPRAGDVSTAIDQSRLAGGEPALSVDLLGVNMGSVEAPVKVIEFVDFGCGYCRQFQMETFPTIQAEFIETDMVEWKFMPFVSGMFRNSEAVTMAAECALAQDPRLFAALANRLWVRQAEWKGADDAEAFVRGWMMEIGADGAAYDTCLESESRMERVASATAFAGQLGVRSTPTFWIVGVGPVQGALPVDAFRQIFTELHSRMTQSDDTGA